MREEKWLEYGKNADFTEWSHALNVSDVTARMIRNRDVETLEDAKKYLYGSMEDLKSPEAMMDMEKTCDLLLSAIKEEKKIGISTDFDCDGIFSAKILTEGIKTLGGICSIYTPNRVNEGYGMNRRIIDQAKEEGCSVLLTCDNGIAAIEEVEYANQMGFTVLVTDHHEVQYEDVDEKRTYLLPKAAAVVDPKRMDDTSGCDGLCGAGVAFYLIRLAYKKSGISKETLEDLYEYAAIATVADVMELKEDNRILVREGLKRLSKTNKPGLQALIDESGISTSKISAYHIGFILGPCFNSSGRLADTTLAFQLLDAATYEEAVPLAKQLYHLNEERKQMTEDGLKQAVELVEEADWKNDFIYLVVVKDCHESLAGIIAGRLKEMYWRPVFVLTETEEGYKGSGRSIPEYHMLDGLLKEKKHLGRFGGHAMAAGVSLKKSELEPLRKAMNEHCGLEKEDLVKKIHFDAQVPLDYLSENFIEELAKLEPYGNGNPKPSFARAHVHILQMRILGKNQNVLKMVLQEGNGVTREGIMFGQVEEFHQFISKEYGDEQWEAALSGKENSLDVAFLFYPEINEFRSEKSIQVVCQSYCRIH